MKPKPGPNTSAPSSSTRLDRHPYHPAEFRIAHAGILASPASFHPKTPRIAGQAAYTIPLVQAGVIPDEKNGGSDMGIKVAKFGGTSLADASQICKVKAIVQADPERRYVVPSAPGKRTPEDRKITDLLYLCHANANQQVPFEEVFDIIADRYLQIVADLQIRLDMKPHLHEIHKRITAGASADYTASRGEYLNGLIVADLLGYDFVDAAEVIFFDDRGRFDAERTQAVLSKRLAQHERAVVPGFYGSLPNGEIKTFSRGGSDISGAIVARGAAADVYEIGRAHV